MRLRSCLMPLLLVTLLAAMVARAQETPPLLAPTPPMGWNSWDSYGLTIDEPAFRANATALAQRLLPFGYEYAVIDEGWFLRNPLDRPHPEQLQFEIDANGRYIPVPARFPSAMEHGTNAGFIALSGWIHAQGLKFGIHIVRGVPREGVARNLPIAGSTFLTSDAADTADACPWDPTNWGVKDNAAGQEWYDSLLQQYAAWGVDLLKVDCIADHPYKASEIRQIHLAIERSGRPIVLSLSPGPTALEHAAEVASLAQLWRISNDIWDVWRSDADFPRTVFDQFANTTRWVAYARPGNWPDADMLPLGELRPMPDVGPGARRTRLTADEQRTLFTLWCMARSPLILGANLTLLDDATFALITDRTLLQIDQHAIESHEQLRRNGIVAWIATLPNGEHVVAVSNVADSAQTVSFDAAALGLPRAAKFQLETTPQLKSVTKLQATLRPHQSLLWLAKP